jgi:dimethylhistidine N-methyltransferase
LDESFRLVELGSGSSVKTRLILDVFDKIQDRIEYFPIDISEILTESSELLQKDYDDLHITGIVDTYEGGLEFIEKYDDKKNLIIFLGSSYGNFNPNDGKIFLKKINSVMKKDDLFLIGLDLVKNKETLENAYDDSQGITAKFNLNVLSRINDELDADFDLDNFQHVAKYNEKDQRIEMYLKSLANQSIIISKANLSLKMTQGELIHTEHSHKYTLAQIEDVMNQTDFKIKEIWLDETENYSLSLVSKK